jgi:solute carrier family 25 uncoupling protein 8/9
MKGLGTNINRNFFMNASELASYDFMKRQLMVRKWEENGKLTHFIAGTFAGFMGAVATNPAEVVKTR